MKTYQTSQNYTACVHPIAGLIVQSSRKAGGVCMPPTHPQYTEYVAAFDTAIDTDEADALCRALLS